MASKTLGPTEVKDHPERVNLFLIVTSLVFVALSQAIYNTSMQWLGTWGFVVLPVLSTICWFLGFMFSGVNYSASPTVKPLMIVTAGVCLTLALGLAGLRQFVGAYNIVTHPITLTGLLWLSGFLVGFDDGRRLA